MRRSLILLISTALAGSPAAFAQTVDQYQAGNATAVTEVDAGSVQDAIATAIAGGNAVTTTAEDTPLAFDNTQHMDGATDATTDATVWHASGSVTAAATAVSNGATANVRNAAADVRSDQLSHGDARAATRFTGASAGSSYFSAAASGNVSAATAENSEIRVISSQESTGAVSAAAEADQCCVTSQTAAAAIASANNQTVGGYTATVLTATRQTATGPSVSARVDLYAGYTTDASGAATANGNAVTIDNQWGYVNAAIDQASSATVAADSYVTLGGDFLGYASSAAYGVGNQANVSNVGSDTVMDVTQSNAGGVSANAALSGEGGMTALASSAAYGNSITGALCSYCAVDGPTLSATSTQTNSADVYSNAVVRSSASTVAATSTAIGNAATYQVRGPGG